MKRAIVIGALLIPSLASAHIHLTYPLSRTDLPTGDQKEQHCGTVGWNRAAMNRITTLQPGATITVTWAETIQHPGFFRIAFQPNGEVFGIPPAGAGVGGFPDQPQLGLDANNQSIVLVDRILDGTLSQQVTLPNMECNNCTLQFIQVMTDKPPYTTDLASDDIYFNCADITLAANAPDAGPQNTTDAGTTDTDAGTGGGNNEVSGGCSTGGNATGGLALGALLFGLRRRRSTK